MRLDAFALETARIDIRPAPFERSWMDATDQRYAYRCLPLNVANASGWELCCPSGFTASWNGGPDLGDLVVVPDPGSRAPAFSHFGNGVLTFNVPALFRTEPGFDLMVQGPINRPKDGVSALTGVVETDWAPFSFTMNWMLTRPGHAVRFEAGEPYGHILPIRRSDLEGFAPRHRSISSEPELLADYAAWHRSRSEFNRALAAEDPATLKQGWQKHYYQGRGPTGAALPVGPHRTKVRLRGFDG